MRDWSIERIAATTLALLLISVARGALGMGASPAAQAPQVPGLEEVQGLLKGGKYAEAENRARELLVRVESEHGAQSLEAAEVLDQLVVALYRGGKVSDPETRQLAERAVGIKRKLLGEENLEIAQSLNSLGNVFMLSGDYVSARPVCQRVLAIREKILGPEHVDVAKILENLGILEMETGNFAAARPLYERALAIKEKALGPEDFAVGRTLGNLGNLLWKSGDYAGAKPLFERQIVVLEKTLGPDHPELATCLHNYAGLLSDTCRYSEAQEFGARALAIQEKVLGPDHPDVARSLNNLAANLDDLGQYGQAIPMYERAIAIYEKALGPDHPNVAETVQNLGNVWLQLGDYSRARSFYERAIAISEKSLGPEHPDLARYLSSLAGLLSATGDRAEALALFERALAILDKTRPEHEDTAYTHNEIGILLTSTGEYARARQHFEQAVAIREKIAGPDSPEVAESLDDFADLLATSRDPAQARPLYERAVSIRQKALGPHHPDVAESLVNLAASLAATGELPDAFDKALEAEEIGREHVRLTMRTLAEQQGLKYARVRTRGLDLALSIAARGADPQKAWRAWDALVRSRALVLDELATRHRALAGSAEPAVEAGARALRDASRRLASLRVRGPRGEPAERYRALLDEAEQEKEHAEVALAGLSVAFRDAQSRERVGLDAVSKSLPPSAALVAYTAYDRYDLGGSEASGSPVLSSPSGTRPPERSYLALVLRPGLQRPEIVTLGPAAHVDSLVASWSREAARGALLRGRSPRAAEAAYRKAGAELRGAIWDPLAPQLAGAQRVLVVPDGALNLVSLASLPVGDADYLVESGPVLHQVSAERDLAHEAGSPAGTGLLALGGPDFDVAASLRAPKQRSSEDSAPAVIASAPAYRGPRSGCGDFGNLRFDALPASSRETREIVALWEKHAPRREPQGQEPAGSRAAWHLTGAAASEAAFKLTAPGRSVVHLATHGFFLGSQCGSAMTATRGIGGLKPAAEAATPSSTGENPLLLSGLALAGANRRDAAGADEEDGILTAEEIGALNLSGVEWAVLSACDTGVGKLEAGEGVMGLRRAFQVAGASTLILSLWSVEDESARAWMRALYQARLRDRKDTAEAVRAANLELLRARRAKHLSTHPFYWAGFVAAGDWR